MTTRIENCPGTINTAGYTAHVWTFDDDIKQISHAWDSLYDRASYASPYLSRAWTEAWLSVQPDRPRVSLYGVTRGERLVALLPLMRSSMLPAVSPVGTGESAYLGMLLDDNEDNAVSVLCGALRKNVQCVYSHDILTNDRASIALFEELRRKGWVVATRARNPAFQTELPATYEEYLASQKSSKSRQTLRRKERQLEKSHRVRVERFRGVDITENVLNRCAVVQESSWMVRRGAAKVQLASTRTVILKMADAGYASVWMLSLDEEDAAFVICFVAKGVVCYKYPSFSLKYPTSLSIGNYLISHVMRDAIADGARVLDFGHGDGDYKRFWGTTTHTINRIIAGHGVFGRATAISASLVWDTTGSRAFKRLRRACSSVRRRLRSLI